eukprot:CAMPEP_0177582012 /NCGR_PEP_ID=MMETSP0419_2-20121207/2477_1 /TAXON_ID=582737 /ORGANISM="Tetraselmis sp., Strain GSL018" /LENGTH=38 /DNA_ID= /DNA_START= /DNA_END= /DNA_ORIENTATION=
MAGAEGASKFASIPQPVHIFGAGLVADLCRDVRQPSSR